MDNDSSLAAKGTQLRRGVLNPTQYAELKRLFLQTVDLPPAERESFVAQVAVVSPLADELRELLNQHTETLGETSRNRPSAASSSRTHRSPSRWYSNWQRQPIVTFFIGCLLMVAAGLALAFRATYAAHEVALSLGMVGLGCWAWGSLVWFQKHRQRDGKLRVGHYTLEQVIGYGGMGIVYRAGHDHLQRPFAVKMLDPLLSTPELIERFEREVHLTAKLTHPNTIAIFDFGRTSDGGLFYAMEFLQGMPLSELMQKAGPLPPARVAYLIQQVCASLGEAHSHGLLHRDIKPANIMACCLGGAGDVVKVLDFGLVKDISKSNKTTVTTLAGTPRYMAPERIWNSGLTDVRSDIYSVGAVAYSLLTGNDLFSDVADSSLIYQVVNRLPPPPSTVSPYQIPAALDDLILACLAKNPDERPSTIQELHCRLESLEFLDTWDRTAAQLWWGRGKSAVGTETVALAHVKSDTVTFKPKGKSNAPPS